MKSFLNRITPFLKSSAFIATLAPAAVLLAPQASHADLNYVFSQVGSDVVLNVNGSVTLPTPYLTGFSDAITASVQDIPASISSGTAPFPTPMDIYRLTKGPFAAFGTYPLTFTAATSSSGAVHRLDSDDESPTNSFWYFPTGTYTSGSPLSSTMTFANKTFASMGLDPTGAPYEWTFNGTGGTTGIPLERIIVSFAAPQSVPGPLPLLGAGAAFGWSRRLRRRARLTRASQPG
ncbi:MAG: hypothetical protein VKI83_08535 [Synechococcaceae cyanobacterium]|nr:hypothetical protein [Synechococcaceae cyanobacterium]